MRYSKGSVATVSIVTLLKFISFLLSSRSTGHIFRLVVIRRGCLINMSKYIYMSKYNHLVTCYLLIKWSLTDKCFYVYNLERLTDMKLLSFVWVVFSQFLIWYTLHITFSIAYHHNRVYQKEFPMPRGNTA